MKTKAAVGMERLSEYSRFRAIICFESGAMTAKNVMCTFCVTVFPTHELKSGQKGKNNVYVVVTMKPRHNVTRLHELDYLTRPL